VSAVARVGVIVALSRAESGGLVWRAPGSEQESQLIARCPSVSMPASRFQ
jgi:hypothetical protein